MNETTTPPDADGPALTAPVAELEEPTPTPATSDDDARGEPWREGLNRRWRTVSLRGRLVGILLVLLVLALSAAGWESQHVLRGVLVDQLDEQLLGPGHGLAQGALQNLGPRRGLPSAFVVRTAFDDPQIESNIQRNDGLTVVPAFQQLTSQAANRIAGRPFTVGSVDSNQQWRVVAYPVTDGERGPIIGNAQVALPLSGVERSVASLRRAVILVGLAVLLIAALLGWLAIRRAFVPLVEMEETAAAIAAGDLSRRIPERPRSTEVGRLTASLNGMLTQIENAFRAREASEARTKRFAADASHELRTPLASIRGFAELFRIGAVPSEEVPRTMRRIEDEATRMGHLVDDLLLLARLDQQRPAQSRQVDLVVLAGDAVHDARGLDSAREVRLVGLTGAGLGPAVTLGDEDRLRQVAANLVANAVRHTPPGTPVEVAVGVEPGLAVLEVRDHGAGLSTEQAEKIFERFYRVDSSRQRGRGGVGGQGGGSGLGLSIVSAVVSAHAGTIQVLTTPGGGATFRVELPAASSERDESHGQIT